MNIIEEIKKDHPKFIKIRRDIHAHPELGYQETRTANLVAQLLTTWGIETHQGIGKTGVVGVLHGSKGAGTHAIGLRADMDALAMNESNRFAHASKHAGCMHACGHDGHTTMLLAAAKYLAQHRDFQGTVNFIFQPAEEGLGGAKAMMDDGLFDRFPCDEIFGMHNGADLPTGKIACTQGAAMASSNTYDITVKGVGGHGAMPHNTVDPVVIACEMVGALQKIISRQKNPDDMGLLSVCKIHGGHAYNVIPDSVKLGGTVRTFSEDVLDLIENNMQQIVEMLPKVYGGLGELNFRRVYPPLINHDAPLEFAASVAEQTFGQENVCRNHPRATGSEDFAFFLKQVPGAYFWIGNGAGDHREAQYEGMGPCTLHNPSFDFNDAILPIGATFWVRLVQEFFKRF